MASRYGETVHPSSWWAVVWPGWRRRVRLAKARHPVRLYEATDRLGGRWASRTEVFPGGTVVLDDAPPVLEFPAPWRDLYRKSGRTLAEEFDRSAAALSAAEPATYVFADGTELSWPTDRGELFAVHEERYGTATADRWRRLVDELDDVWQTVRKLGWEAELTGRAELTGPVRRRIRQERTIAELAEEIDSARTWPRCCAPAPTARAANPRPPRPGARCRSPSSAASGAGRCSRTASTTTGTGPGGRPR